MEDFLCKTFKSPVENYFTNYENILNRRQRCDETFDNFVTDLKVMWSKMEPDRSNIAGLHSNYCEMFLIRHCVVYCRPEIREKLPIRLFTNSLEELTERIRVIEEDINRPKRLHDVTQNEIFSTPAFNPFSFPPPVLNNVTHTVPSPVSSVHASPHCKTPVNRFKKRDRNHPYSDRSNSNNTRFNLRPRKNVSFVPNHSKNGQSLPALMPPP